jgi:hypothetical protein
MTRRARSPFVLLAAACCLCACSQTADTAAEAPGSNNPFLADQANHGKDDSGYFNPDGIEVEVDLEGDAVASTYRLFSAPAELGQFALTWFRKRGEFYLESLAEDSGSEQQVEWLVGDQWLSSQQARSLPDTSVLKRFRIRGVNAVLLHQAAQGVKEGSEFTAKVPAEPYKLFSQAKDRCADANSHITLDQSVYWYLWNPDKAGCDAPIQELRVTVSKMFPQDQLRYPEYDQLTKDGKVTAVMLFGQVGDGAVTESDWGVKFFNQTAKDLKSAGYQESDQAPVGRRFSKKAGDVTLEVDLYSPFDFAGLGDSAHFANLQRAISEHEIVVYRGHSMLGASDFWTRPVYPDFYQIFVYGGCLGYEYYIRPIVQGKGGWTNLDLVSSVVEVSASDDIGGTFVAKLAWSLNHQYAASWKDILGAIRQVTWDSTFGASGVRENCFSPQGSLCAPPPDPAALKRYDDNTPLVIPDGSENGVSASLQIPDALIVKAATLEVELNHPAANDLLITLEHDGVQTVGWNGPLESGDKVPASIDLPDFAGKSAAGSWTLTVIDELAGDQGTLNRWSLVLEPQ